MPDLEYRWSYNVRAADDSADGVAGRIIGHSSTFWDVDSYYTAMAPGAFQKSLSERSDSIKLLFQHRGDTPALGIPDVHREDEKGLYVEALIFDDGADGTVVMRHMRTAQSLSKPSPYGLSFGFQTLQDRSATDDDPLDFSQLPNVNRSEIRVITEVKLWEHSVVTFPANDNAAIEEIRQRAHTDALRALLDDLREDRISDTERDLVAQIVAAFPGSPEDSVPPGPVRTARRLDAEIALAQLTILSLDVARNTA